MSLHGMTIFTILSHLTPRTRTRYRTIAGVGLSILIHVSLFFMLRFDSQKMDVQANAAHQPLEVRLTQSQPKSPSAIVKQAAAPPKIRRPTKQQRKNAATPRAASSAGRAAKPQAKKISPRQVARVTPRPAPMREARPLPLPSPAMTPAPPEMDMLTMLNIARGRRRADEESAAHKNAAEGAPSANDIAQANIDFQAQKANGPHNGMFQIISQGPRIAQYLYFGWGTDIRHKKKQTITVDAGLNGDVEMAIVNSMIALIRKDVSRDDFIFESQKLGRNVRLSARPEDTAGLQAFLLREFF